MSRKLLSMAGLAALLLSSVSAHALVFNEAKDPIAQAKEDLYNINEQMASIQATADAENRELTAEEITKIDTLSAQFDTVEADLERRERLEAQRTRLSAGRGRQTEPEGGNPNPKAANGGTRRNYLDAMPKNERDKRTFGFNSFGEFAQKVRASGRGNTPDPRLVMNAPDPAREGVGSEGGFAIPPDFRSEIVQKVFGEDSLLARTDQLTSSGNQITFPMDETTPWQDTGGIQAYWENEGTQHTQSKPDLNPVTVRANKLAAIIPVTDELLEDAPALSSYLGRKTPEKFTYKVNEAIVRGSGAGMPKGFLNSGSLITVAKESGQHADTVNFQNIVNMYSRVYAPWRRNAAWLINQDLEPQLMGLKFPVDSGNTSVPVFMPSGGLSAAPYATLLGKPIIPLENMAAVGDLGDIAFVDLNQYMTLTKNGGQIKQDVSIHLWFDYDVTAFKFTMRVGGQPWWNTAISRPNGLSRSAFVALAARG